MTILRPVFTFFLYAILAVAAQNAIFSRALGVSRLVKMVEDGSVELFKFGLLLTIVQFFSSLLGYFVSHLLLQLDLSYKTAFLPLVLVLCSTVVFLLVLLAIALAGNRIAARDYLELLPMATFNCCIIGALLLTTTRRLYAAANPRLRTGQLCGLCAGGHSGQRGAAQDPKPQPARGFPRTADHPDLYRDPRAGHLRLYRPYPGDLIRPRF